ncbi:hypothetical protein ACIA5D_36365 [Actinoplanes sp. NPDC051513]|uniref:hypothetical protein n=1 Tax=Actinoplanes sp. NPDC051513 TaxID=3363908 RepID=UPI0037A716DF
MPLIKPRTERLDGAENPRKAGAFYDAIAVITILAGLLAAWMLGVNEAPGSAIFAAIGGIVSGMLIHTSAIAMRWLAAMYELASRGFEPEATARQSPPVTADSGRAHRRAA